MARNFGFSYRRPGAFRLGGYGATGGGSIYGAIAAGAIIAKLPPVAKPARASSRSEAAKKAWVTRRAKGAGRKLP